MNDIIDNEFAKGSLPDLTTILKWLLIGILGCIVFQNFEYLLERTLIDFLNTKGILGGTTGYFFGSIFSIIPTLIVFSSVIKSFKKKYYNNQVNIQRTIRKLVITYVIIVVLQLILPVISNIFNNYSAGAPDPLSIFSSWIGSLYIVESFIKYGIVASILLKKE